MYIQSGRPDISNTLQSVITGVRGAYYSTGWSDDSSAEFPRGIVVGSCGPTALIDDAAQAVGRVSWADWKDVGGVETVEEYVCPFLILSLLSLYMLNGYRTGFSGCRDSPLIYFFFSAVAGQHPSRMALR